MSVHSASAAWPDDSAVEDRLAAELLELAERAARLAGEELLERESLPHKISTKSTPTDLVSEADRAAEQTILEQILRQRPQDGLVAEEGTRRESQTDITWVVDPLDGTVNYLFGDREWSVSIAAVDAKGPRAAVVLEPVTGRTWTAIRNHGAWRDGTRLEVRPTTKIADAMVLMGLSYDSAQRGPQMEMFTQLAARVRDLRRHGSAALELCRVAEGGADAYVESPVYRWDIAAGSLIAREAGARVHVAQLDELRRSIVATAPAISQNLLVLLQSSPFGSDFFAFLEERT